MPDLFALGVQGAAPYSLTVLGTTFAGIGLSHRAGTTMDIEIVDTLLGLGGAVVGAGIVGTTTAIALPSFGITGAGWNVGSTIGGLAGLYGGFFGVVVPLTMVRNSMAKRVADGFEFSPGGMPTVALDRAGNVVSIAPIAMARF